jgi:hypothetical protein
MVSEPVDELDVELARVALDEHCLAVAVGDGGRTLVRHRRQPRQRLLGRGGCSVEVELGPAGEDPVRREDEEAWIRGGDEHRENARAAGRSLLRMEGERCLVAVVAVGDQQLPAEERLGDTGLVGQPPEPRALHRDIRIAIRSFDRRRRVMEEEDRLELRASCAQQP